MKRISILLALALVAVVTLPATAEVEEVTVGGSIQVRGQYLGPGVGDPRINPDIPLPLFLVDVTGNGVPDWLLGGLPTSFDDDINSNDWIIVESRMPEIICHHRIAIMVSEISHPY